jgi:hypothetical protein
MKNYIYQTALVLSKNIDEFCDLLQRAIDEFQTKYNKVEVQYSTCVKNGDVFHSALISGREG